ncbi:rhomboid family protein [Richelia sinica FACHB-800]|uniref:Rhomboid family protein n=2 Tax=Richelia sinica FACHB-800 TaxID=1357546 RepID=A0A975Y3K8_9NOST|nr:rhomboid family intramembrane serine protease [Richelia sinica]MBD2664360.1 rhomboid family intramembrane serine protease [Richelia sinica FACHB-800]QXE22243.1 rhomboid family protein [Richelia sinica FACHB-800]
MIPVSDNVIKWNKPIINYWLIGINISIFLWEIYLAINDNLGNFINNWGIIPAQTNGAITNAVFYNSAAWIVVFWRLLSLPIALFIHSSFSQILGNMLFLWVFGQSVEAAIGQRRYIVLYLASGIFCGMVQSFFDPNLTIPIVGANGAIASILGAYIMKYPQARIYSVLPLIFVYIPVELPAFLYVCWWFVQQAFYGIGSLNIPGGVNQSHFALWGQFAALVTGAAFMRMVTRR